MDQLPPWPVLSEQQVAAAEAVLRSGLLNARTGRQVNDFESRFAEWVGVRHGLALANGTVSLEVGLRALGVGPGDVVLTSPRSFIASASCALAVGAEVRFVDVDMDSGNLSVAGLEAAWDPRAKAIVLVHLAGWPADAPAIVAWARSRNLWVVEDCAQAHGATIGGQMVGTFGDLCSFSFCQDKILTTGGEGGFLGTNLTEVWRKARQYKDHGKDLDHQSPPGSVGYVYLHAELGTNFRMTEVQAAIGLAGMGHLDAWLAERHRNAMHLAKGLAAIPGLRVPLPETGVVHAFYRLYAYLQPETLAPGWDRDRVLVAFEAEGVPGLSGGCPEIYLEKGIPHSWKPAQRLPHAQALGETSLAFLVHPGFSEAQLDRLLAGVQRVMAQAVGG